MNSYSKVISLCVITFFVTSACSNTNKIINETATHNSAVVEGKVKDVSNQDPVPNATVRVEGTTITGSTNDEGSFSLSVPKGYYEIQADRDGYTEGLRIVEVKRNSRVIENFDFEITEEQRPESGNLNVSVSGANSGTNGHNSGDSKKHENFISYYINNDLNCSLENPGDIHFAQTPSDEIRINNPVKLHIMNHDLGYKIRVDLNSFISKDYGEILGTDVDAEYYFEELEPENEEQAKRWEKNREKYFEGSLRHFLIALASNKSALTFGYRMYSGQSVNTTSAMAFSSSTVTDVEVEKIDLINNNVVFEQSENFVISFEDELRVEYVRKGVNDPADIMGLDDYDNQTSWITLNNRYAEFTNNGIIIEPESVDLKGVWRYTPVCEMLPKDYLPSVN